MSPAKTLELPRLVLSAPSGGTGKTLATAALLAAFRRKGIAVAPFKKGPDFIDPKWLSLAAGRTCYNLDYHLCPDGLYPSFVKNSRGAEIAVIDGNHGFYDSIDAEGKGSTAHLARLLSAPVILVVNCRKLSRSIAAIVHGFATFEPGVDIAGVILNQVSGQRHEEKLRMAMEKNLKIPVLGAIYASSETLFDERHLGIVTTENHSGVQNLMNRLEEIGSTSLDLDAILEIARSARPLGVSPHELPEKPDRIPDVTIAVARDAAFNFYYPDNLESLEANGARLVEFSPLDDFSLPAADALYFGGGYPELFAEKLSGNRALRKAVYDAVEMGMPVYAECGGMMYLCSSIEQSGISHEMTGNIPATCQMTSKPQGRGYVELVVQPVEGTETLWELPSGTRIRAHEFHFSRLEKNSNQSDFRMAYRMNRGEGMFEKSDGFLYRNLLAGYVHLHACSAPWWAPSFVEAARRWRKSRL